VFYENYVNERSDILLVEEILKYIFEGVMAVVSSSIYGIWGCLSDFFELKKLMSIFSIEGIIAYGLGVPIILISIVHSKLKKIKY
jgi:hypothetical protein